MGDNNNAIMIPTQAIIPQARDKKVIVYQNGIADFNTSNDRRQEIRLKLKY